MLFGGLFALLLTKDEPLNLTKPHEKRNRQLRTVIFMRAHSYPFNPTRVRFSILICLIVLTAVSFAPIRVAGKLQDPTAAKYNAAGLELIRSGKFEEAVDSYKKAIKLKKDYSEAHFNLGDAYFLAEQYKKAVEAYKQAVRYQPDFITAHNNLGTAYYRLGEYKKAIESYKQSIRLYPKQSMVYYNLGGVYAERGDQQTALEQYQILKTIDAPLAEKLYLLIYKPMVTVSEAASVRLNVIVTDSQGNPVTNLSKNDFEVLEDRIPQTISTVAVDQLPLLYALVVDMSGSIRSAAELIVKACHAIVQNNSPADETTLIRFVSSDTIQITVEFTSNKVALSNGINELYIEGGLSSILDAVYLSTQRVAQYKFGDKPSRRAVLLVTDGEERSSHYDLKDVLKLLRKIDVQIFALSLSRPDGNKLNDDQPQPWIDLLSRFAQETGGKAFFPKSETELELAIKEMMSLIRAQYVIEYKSSSPAAADVYRQVKVDLMAKPGSEKLNVVTRPGYLVSEPFKPAPK